MKPFPGIHVLMRLRENMNNDVIKDRPRQSELFFFTDTEFPAYTYLYNLVPKLKDLSRTSFYSYKGSLTTPPCYQSVNWIVLKKTISAGEEEVIFLNYWNTILERNEFNLVQIF